jgi:hypothetical protein
MVFVGSDTDLSGNARLLAVQTGAKSDSTTIKVAKARTAQLGFEPLRFAGGCRV